MELPEDFLSLGRGSVTRGSGASIDSTSEA